MIPEGYGISKSVKKLDARSRGAQTLPHATCHAIALATAEARKGRKEEPFFGFIKRDKSFSRRVRREGYIALTAEDRGEDIFLGYLNR